METMKLRNNQNVMFDIRLSNVIFKISIRKYLQQTRILYNDVQIECIILIA